MNHFLSGLENESQRYVAYEAKYVKNDLGKLSITYHRVSVLMSVVDGEVKTTKK